MRSAIALRLKQSAAFGGFLLLAACAGGGGGGGGGIGNTPAPTPVPTPTPTPVPTPVPTPTPTPTGNDNNEYRSTVGAVSMNALTAYDHGATGAAIKIGIIDSGIDLQSSEFGDCTGGIGTGTCRILGVSRDSAGNASIDDEGGHGTAVAFTIAGRRNGAGTHGVAFNAQLIVLRADSPGSCATENSGAEDSGCNFNDNAIAAALNTARTNGAKVVNISLGGSAPNGTLTNAINQATTAGLILVISAGNDGREPEGVNPDPFAAVATNNAVSHGLVIIAGSVGTNDVISAFSNRAGTGKNFYLAAVGEQVRAPNQSDTPFLWSGTSFSAPQITGAIALIAQAFPNLTATQIVELLYATARDAGDPGIDDIYGRGILDLTRAFQPVGSMSLAGSLAPTSTSVNATLSAPMGDARQGSLGAVVLDGFRRAYQMDLAQTIDRDGPARQLPALMASRQHNYVVGVHDMSVAVTLVPTRDAVGSMAVERLGLSSGDARQAQILAASVIGRLGGSAKFAIGASESGNALTARLAGRDDPAFLVARDPSNASGFDVDVGASVAVRQKLGGWGVTLAQEVGDVLTRRDTNLFALMSRPERFGYSRSTLGLDREFGGLRAGVSATRLAEDNSVLGARFAGGLGAARADSVFVDIGARMDFGGGWTLGGSLRQGWTHAHLRGGVEGSGMIRTNGFAADFGKAGVFWRGDRMGFRFAQPLRVSNGGINYLLPALYDYGTESVTQWNAARLNLAPEGRELDFEFAYVRPFLGGDIGANLFVRRDPGNFAMLRDDRGGAVRVSFGF